MLVKAVDIKILNNTVIITDENIRQNNAGGGVSQFQNHAHILGNKLSGLSTSYQRCKNLQLCKQ